MADHDKRYADLADRYVLGCISEEEFAELQDLLRESPDRRVAFVSQLDLDSLLRTAGSYEDTAVAGSIPDTAFRWRAEKWRIVALSATISTAAVSTATILLVLIAFGWGPEISQQPDGRNETTVAAVASPTLAELPVGFLTSWGEPSAQSVSSHQRQPIASGSLRFGKGYHDVALASGAMLIVAGPAEIDFRNADDILVQQGRVRVDTAGGVDTLTVRTPAAGMTLSDVQLEAAVGDDGAEEFHVMRGEVEVSSRYMADSVRVTSNQAVTLSQEQLLRHAKSAPSRMADRQWLEARLASRSRADFNRWLTQRDRITRDQRAVACFSFQRDTADRRMLTNEISGQHDGTIVGCEWARGRWPQKEALDFKSLTRHVVVNIEGEFSELTYFASLRVDGLAWPFQAIMNSDYWEPRTVHWQLRNDNSDGVVRLEMGVSTDGAFGESYTSAPILNWKSLGQWMTIATTLDTKNGQVRHFHNGKCVSEHRMKNTERVRIGRARIGNFYTGRPFLSPLTEEDIYSVRPLNGRIDDMVVFSSALSDDEILALTDLRFGDTR